MVILGGERVVPLLDRLWREHGALAAYRVIQRCVADSQPIRVRCLPLCRAHLGTPWPLRGNALGARARLHTARLRKQYVAQIHELVPDYPVLQI